MSTCRILAAGGILWRNRERAELAVVHRHRHDDWCLPKGKLADGETFEAAALREVAEETGHEARVVGYIGEMFYEVDGRPKSVLIFDLVCESEKPDRALDPDEVIGMEWLTPAAALARLTYDLERELLRGITSTSRGCERHGLSG